ncbi:MAG: MFS transporter, partial [Bryobacteraceae bacterium]
MKRWAPAAALMLVSVLSYVDRNTLALLAPTILKDTKLTVAQYGWAVSAYSILFAVSNPLWGKLLDRIGVRRGMIAAVSIWTAASVAHVFARGLGGFASARALLGFGEGASSPGGLRTVMETLPCSSRSRGMALTFSGGSLGAIVTPILMTPVALRWGWRAAFWCTGLLGAAWIGIWLVAGAKTAGPSARPGAPDGPALANPSLRDSRVWAYIAAYSLGAAPLGFVVYSQSIYLNHALGISQKIIGEVFWLPPLGSEIGVFFWGWMVDRL